MKKALALLFLIVVVATPSPGETVRGTLGSGSAEPTYMFWPQSSEKVELTLMWLRRGVNLDMVARCFDEIGSEFTTVYSESGHDRIERLEFGGWSGAVCTVQVFSVDGGVKTKYLLNLQLSSGSRLEEMSGSFSARTESAAPESIEPWQPFDSSARTRGRRAVTQRRR